MAKKVLVCDDDAGVLDVISILLKIYGFEVFNQAHSIKIFYDIAIYKPELVIVDLWMPGLSGDDITRRLKSAPETQHIPVIISSASRDGEKIAHAAEADKFVQKPFDIHDLLNTINSLLKVG